MDASRTAALAVRWAELWNGNLAVADEIIHPTFLAHAAPLTGTGGQEIHGIDALKAWVSGGLSIMPDLHFSPDVGPIVDGPYVVLRWKAQGTYGGGLPGSAPEAVGRLVSFTGTDILRVLDGKLAEYWANADSLYFIQQLGVRQVPLLD